VIELVLALGMLFYASKFECAPGSWLDTQWKSLSDRHERIFPWDSDALEKIHPFDLHAQETPKSR
jgi:hypothetical protein